MSHVNLGQLVSGRSCTIPYTLFRNRYQVLTSTLANSKVNTFTLIDTQYAVKLANFLNTPIKELPKLIPIRGYNRRIGPPITTILWIYLHINRRRQYNVPFLIMDLGSYNIILGRKWLAYLGLQLNIRNRQLVQPETLPLTPSFIKEISIIIENLIRPQINTIYQADATYRDQAFKKDIQLNSQRIYILRRPQTTYITPPALKT